MGIFSSIFGGGNKPPEYQPYNTTTGIGSVNIDKGTHTVTTSLDPRYQEIVDSLTGGLSGISPSYSQGTQALGAQATQAGAGFLGALNADPNALAQSQYSLMESVLNPQRDQDRAALEARLLRQGRLGSTGGARTQGAFEQAIDTQRQQELYNAMMQGQQVQAQNAQLGTSLGAFGADVENQQLQRLLQSLGGATSLESMPAAAGGNIAQNTANANYQADYNRSQASSGGFGNILGGLADAALAYYSGGGSLAFGDIFGGGGNTGGGADAAMFTGDPYSGAFAGLSSNTGIMGGYNPAVSNYLRS